MSEIIEAKIDWFIDRLSYYKDGTTEDYAEVKDYIRHERMSADNIEDLWYMLRATRKYRTFPPIGEINEVYREQVLPKRSLRKNDRYDDIIDNNNKVMASWEKMCMKEILHILVTIRKNPVSEWSFTDKEFWAVYDALFFEFRGCKDKEMNSEDMKDHLEYVFRQMKAGEWFKSILSEKRLPVDNERKGIQPFGKAIKMGGVE